MNVMIGNCSENEDEILLVSVVDKDGVYTGEHYHVHGTHMLNAEVSANKFIVLSVEVPLFTGIKND